MRVRIAAPTPWLIFCLCHNGARPNIYSPSHAHGNGPANALDGRWDKEWKNLRTGTNQLSAREDLHSSPWRLKSSIAPLEIFAAMRCEKTSQQSIVGRTGPAFKHAAAAAVREPKEDHNISRNLIGVCGQFFWSS